MKVVFFLLVLIKLVFIQQVRGEGFEGNITFVKQTFYDTTFYVFSVKNKLVRIDEENSHKQIIQSLVINTATKSITALSPSQKMYTTIFKNHVIIPCNDKVIKTNNYKLIEGYKCYQWRIKNNSENSEISMWVCALDFHFFNDVVSLLTQTDDYSGYCKFFYALPLIPGYFPILVEERTFLRESKMNIAVHDISHREISEKVFEIPGEYKCLRN